MRSCISRYCFFLFWYDLGGTRSAQLEMLGDLSRVEELLESSLSENADNHRLQPYKDELV